MCQRKIITMYVNDSIHFKLNDWLTHFAGPSLFTSLFVKFPNDYTPTPGPSGHLALAFITCCPLAGAGHVPADPGNVAMETCCGHQLNTFLRSPYTGPIVFFPVPVDLRKVVTGELAHAQWC